VPEDSTVRAAWTVADVSASAHALRVLRIAIDHHCHYLRVAHNAPRERVRNEIVNRLLGSRRYRGTFETAFAMAARPAAVSRTPALL
jgi:hypothetical protein